MNCAPHVPAVAKPLHPWLHTIRLAFVPGPMTPTLKEVTEGLVQQLRRLGHEVQTAPDDTTDAILTTAPFGKVMNWRNALLLTARHRFQLEKTPVVYTMLCTTPNTFQQLVSNFDAALAKDEPDAADFDFPGLAPEAYHTLYEQGHRGGSILSLMRLLQVQCKCIRVLLLIGDERPMDLYHFDLVGAHPRSVADDPAFFYNDIALRMVTTLCSSEVTAHQVVGDSIAYSVWQTLDTPLAMREAARQLGRRNFFTKMVRINDLVHVPSVGDAVASQYSEGCFSTWDPTIEALVATVTGSARPLNKDNITEDDLAVIVDVRPDGKGALVRHVEGKNNAPPSSESVEMMCMDRELPTVTRTLGHNAPTKVPVLRSKLHGHRGVAAYHPQFVEYAPLDEPYFHYLVSCATDAQARGVQDTFARAEALQNPQDPRQVAFAVLPGHGTVIVEKWVEGKAPFQIIWEYMDAGYLQVDNRIPQGPMEYLLGADGRMVLCVDPGPEDQPN